MKTNWDIKNHPRKKKGGIRRSAKAIKSFLFNTNVPLHRSDHYVRDHFHK